MRSYSQTNERVRFQAKFKEVAPDVLSMLSEIDNVAWQLVGTSWMSNLVLSERTCQEYISRSLAVGGKFDKAGILD
jgi:hypothetical protein